MRLPLFIYAGLSLFLFWAARHAGFAMDWYGWEYRYIEGGWSDVLSSFGYSGMHPVLHFFNYLFYSVLGVKSLGWYVFFCILHGANAWLLQEFMLRLVSKSHVKLGFAGIAALLFLASPYAVEPVVWRVCVHYLLTVFFTFLVLFQAVSYFESGEKKHIVRGTLFFLLGLFAFEWSLVLPIILAIFVLIFPSENAISLKKRALFLVPIFGFFLAYFTLNVLVVGDVVGHYGAATHLKVDPVAQIGKAHQYFFKNLLLTRYWPHGSKTAFSAFLENKVVFGLLFISLLGGGIAWLVYSLKNKIKEEWRWAGFGLVAFFIGLAPVINFVFYDLLFSENDRYNYPAIAFFLMGICFLLSSFWPRINRLILFGVLGFSFFFQQKTIKLWAESEKMMDSLVQDFHWFDAENVLLLGIPNNYQGAYMFRQAAPPSTLQEVLELRRGKSFEGRMQDAVQYNAVSPDAAIRAEVFSVDSLGLPTYKISFAQDGNWWWRGNVGASNFEDDWYRFERKEWHAEVTLKKNLPNTVVLYPVGGRWVELK